MHPRSLNVRCGLLLETTGFEKRWIVITVRLNPMAQLTQHLHYDRPLLFAFDDGFLPPSFAAAIRVAYVSTCAFKSAGEIGGFWSFGLFVSPFTTATASVTTSVCGRRRK